MRLLLLLLTTAATVIGGAAQGCNYYQDFGAGQTFQVYSPNYPSSYPKGTDCRWEAVAPSNSKLTLTCNDFSLPYVSNYNAVMCRCLCRAASGLFCTRFL
jgi:hypothetical protein